MGWLKPGITNGWTTRSDRVDNSTTLLKTLVLHDTHAEHVEKISQRREEADDPQYITQPISRTNNELPFIPSSVVKDTESRPNALWIVVDNIVYDCSEFVWSHPGGNTVIENFNGNDCSWQFWRFHGRQHLENDGRPLRIGRTAGVENCFKERPRFVGLKSLAADEGW